MTNRGIAIVKTTHKNERLMSAVSPRLPARYDHVGSFLRPKFLLDAREKKSKGEISASELRAVEDKAIADIVDFQQSVGLKSITDGEFRRTYFHVDFLNQLRGVDTLNRSPLKSPMARWN